MEKEKWFQPNDATRGFQVKHAKMRYHLWKLLGESVFHLLRDPLGKLRNAWLRLFGARIGDQCYISSKCIIVTPFSLTMGNGCCLDQYSYVNGEVRLGNNVSLSSFVKLVAGGHDVRSRHFEYQDKPITIDNSVFIGANTVIMGGVKVGTFACIGANSFVLRDIPENCIAYGSPCEVHSERLPEEEYHNYSY